MKRLALAIAFACVLSGVTRAGEIHSTESIAAPAPGTVTPTTGATAPETSNSVLTIILALLDIVP